MVQPIPNNRLVIAYSLHALKSAVAGVAALYIGQILKLPQPYWASISALVVMGADIGETFQASRDRFIGTVVGAASGAVFALIEANRLLWFGFAVFVTNLVCQFLGLKQSLRLAGVTVAIIMLTGGSASPWLTTVNRVLEVSVGIVLALGVSLIPPRGASNTN